jgi:hypothetical protein
MADLYGSSDVTLRNDDGSKIVNIVTTPDTLNRLCVETNSPNDPASIVQAGNAFYLNSLSPLTVASGATYDVLIITGTTKEIHLKDVSVNVLKNAASGNTQYLFFGDVVTSNNGTSLTVFNNNRRSAITPDFTAYHTPTITSTGTSLLGYLTHSDWETYVAPSYTNTWEYVLKTNAKYLLRFYNNTNQSNTFTFLYWLYQDAI